MIEITSPDTHGITRIKVDGIERYTIQPLKMRATAVEYYGQDVEYAVRPVAHMSGEWFYLSESDALAKAMDQVGKYYL